MKYAYGVIGGDRRQAELADLLAVEGKAVCTYGLGEWDTSREVLLENVLAAERVILPLPLSRGDGMLNGGGNIRTCDLFDRMVPGQLVLAGKVQSEQQAEAERAGVILIDYLQREELATANAVPTAEGAIQIAMERLPVTLWGTNCLVLGFGRIGRVLAHRLNALGSQITVAARRQESVAWAETMGYGGVLLSEIDPVLKTSAVIFNTIPALVLGETRMACLAEDCLCIDLASVRGMAETTHPVLWARGLPGKTAPRTAALVIRRTLAHIIKERGDPD